MDRLPRLLVLIGSGELAAQMTRGHRMLVERLIGGRGRAADVKVRAAIIDTPYGFQSNADALSATLLDYFGRRIGMDASIASLRRSDDDVVARETAYERVREAEFVFSGPGSPSYALRHWKESRLPELMSEKLHDGGALVFASAAALTLGRLTVPVYEIYKGGSDPYWLDGLDVLSTIGISAAVIPHYDNTEGTGHDTRFCFLGERRLAALEEKLPSDVFVLGIDEHTAMLVDIDEGKAFVHGRGDVTIRSRGESDVIASGETFDLSRLTRPEARATEGTARLDSIDADDSASLARRLLALEDRSASLDQRARLAEPLVESLLALRQQARETGDFATADDIRKRLIHLGVEVTDEADGTTRFRLPD